MNDNLFYLTLTLSIIAVLVSGLAIYNSVSYPDVDTSGIGENNHLINALEIDSARTTNDINNLMLKVNNLDLMDEDDLEDLQDDIDNLEDDANDNEEDIDDIIGCLEEYARCIGSNCSNLLHNCIDDIN